MFYWPKQGWDCHNLPASLYSAPFRAAPSWLTRATTTPILRATCTLFALFTLYHTLLPLPWLIFSPWKSHYARRINRRPRNRQSTKKTVLVGGINMNSTIALYPLIGISVLALAFCPHARALLNANVLDTSFLEPRQASGQSDPDPCAGIARKTFVAPSEVVACLRLVHSLPISPLGPHSFYMWPFDRWHHSTKIVPFLSTLLWGIMYA